jgi:hypothetical protein
MKARVAWVYQRMRTDEGPRVEAGQQPSLCLLAAASEARGKGGHMLAVATGHPVRALKRPAADFAVWRQVWDGGAEYGVAKAIETLRGVASRCGITDAADRLLTAAAAGAEFDEDEFEDEEDLTNRAPGAPKETEMTTAEGGEAGATASGAGTASGGAPGKKKGAGRGKKAARLASGKPATGKKAPGKAPAGAKAKKVSDGTPRDGTVGREIYDLLKKGKSNEDAAAAVKKEAAYVAWWRWKLTKAGLLEAAPKEAKAKKKG